VSNNSIRQKIEELIEAINAFHKECSMAVAFYHSEDHFHHIGKMEPATHEKKLLELKKPEEIDEIGLVAYHKLIELTDYLSKRDLL